jgi:chromatin segregation and condensation protein Rec8/ScpA/Scc1 (kleisin family)
LKWKSEKIRGIKKMLNQMYQSLTQLRQFLEAENAKIKQNKLREVRDDMPQKEMLWDQYLQLFDKATAAKALVGENRKQVLEQIRQLTTLAEENRELIGEVLQSFERSVKRYVTKNINANSAQTPIYNRAGRLGTYYGKAVANRPTAFSLNQVL